MDHSALAESPVPPGDQESVLVAAFGIQAVKPGMDFVAYRRWQASDGTFKTWQMRGAVRDDDIRQWR
jgi:hypothetical protein